MKPKDAELLWLYLAKAHESAARGSYEDAHSHAQKALDMIVECSARRKQSSMAVDAIAYRDQRKSS